MVSNEYGNNAATYHAGDVRACYYYRLSQLAPLSRVVWKRFRSAAVGERLTCFMARLRFHASSHQVTSALHFRPKIRNTVVRALPPTHLGVNVNWAIKFNACTTCCCFCARQEKRRYYGSRHLYEAISFYFVIHLHAVFLLYECSFSCFRLSHVFMCLDVLFVHFIGDC